MFNGRFLIKKNITGIIYNCKQKLTETVPKALMSKSVSGKALDLDKEVGGDQHVHNLLDLPLLHDQHKAVDLLEDEDGPVAFLLHYQLAHSFLSTPKVFLSEF